MSVFIPIPKKDNAKEWSNQCTIALIPHASRVMLKSLQARLQQYVNQELPDVRPESRKGRGTRDQIANIHRIIKNDRKKSEVAQSCPTFHDPTDTRLLRPWGFLGKSTGMGCHFLLQRTSQPRDRTQVSHIVDRHFLSEPPLDLSQKAKKR